MILQMNPEYPQPRRIDRVVEVLKEGKLIAYPTDTVYAIGCDITNKNAIKQLNRLVSDIKGSPSDSPLSFICKDLSDLSTYAHVSNEAYRIMKRCLPGAYTFILEASRLVPKIVLCKRKTVGIRVPDAPIPLAIVHKLGNPLASTSAALLDGDLIPDPWTINDLYGHMIEIIVDGGYLHPEPSTIVDFSDKDPVLLREGKGPIDLL